MVESLKPGYFIINGLKSKDYNVFIQDRPDIETPKRRVTFESPNGYEGELAYDDEGYEPTEFELSCFYDGRSHNDSDRDISLARNKINFLFNHGIGEWLDFIPYFDQSHIYKVIMTDLTYENKYFYQGCISFKVKLKCQPFKYNVDNQPVTVRSGDVVTNPNLYFSRPTVQFSGVTGNLKISIGSAAMTIKDLQNETIVIDSTRYIVYAKSGSNITNKNNNTVGKEFFKLYPGGDLRTNRVYFTATKGSPPANITLIPNWRVLV